MSVVVTNIGSSTTVAGGAVTITVGAGGVPAGAHIIVVGAWNATSNLPTITDTAGNTYQISGNAAAQANNNTSALGASAVFRERTGGALTNGNTITFTLPATSTLAAVSAFYATGLDSVGSDTSFYNSAFGFSSTPSVTSNLPGGHHTDELVVAVVSGSSAITTYTQDSTNANWQSPPGVISTAAPVMGGGWVINHSGGTLTYAPTFDVSDSWAATIVGYASIPAFGFDIQQVDAPRAQSAARRAATRAKSEFGVFPNSPRGWEVQPIQHPHPATEKRGAVLRGDEGNQSPFVLWFNAGEVQPPQPPHPRPERTGAILRGDEGNQSTFINWFNAGHQVQPPQPPHPRPERSGAIQIGDAGTQNTIPLTANLLPMGWEVQSPQPPRLAFNRFDALTGGDLGNEFPLPWVNYGWDIGHVQPPHFRSEARAAGWLNGDTGVYDLYKIWTFKGWEVEPVQPPHRGPETKAASWLYGDNGVYDLLRGWQNYGWDVQPVQPPHRQSERNGAYLRGDDGVNATFVGPMPVSLNWESDQIWYGKRPPMTLAALKHRTWFIVPPNLLPAGWETQPPQPPHPRPEKGGLVPFGHQGIDPIIIPPPVPGSWEPEMQETSVRRVNRGAGISGRADFANPTPFVTGWNIYVPDFKHPRPEKAGSIAPFASGIDGVFVAPLPVALVGGADAILPFAPHPRFERSGALMLGDSGTEAKFVFVSSVPFADGWELVTATVPPHPRFERAGSIMLGDQGNQSPFVFVPPAPPILWGADFTSFVYAYRLNRGPAIEGASEFAIPSQSTWGWDAQLPPFVYPPWHRAAALMRGDDGIEFITSQVAALFAGVGGLTVSASFIQHMCVIPGPGPAILPSEPGPGPKVC